MGTRTPVRLTEEQKIRNRALDTIGRAHTKRNEGLDAEANAILFMLAVRDLNDDERRDSGIIILNGLVGYCEKDFNPGDINSLYHGVQDERVRREINDFHDSIESGLSGNGTSRMYEAYQEALKILQDNLFN